MRSSGVGASRAGASARYHHRTLAAEHRWERRAVRSALACGAGIVAVGVSVWWAGPLVAVLFYLGHSAYVRFRPGPVTSWRQGARAERRTGRRLSRLDPAAFHVLHDRALPEASLPSTNLDHLVVGLSGVYAIASRQFRWGARLRVEQQHLWVGDRSVAGVTSVAERAAETVAEMLSKELSQDVEVTPVVVVHGARLARDGLRHRGVLFHAARMVPRTIASQPVIYTSAQVAAMAAAAERLLPPMMKMILPE